MNNKKGLSDVITTVLIVLLTLVAVGLLWGFLSPLFLESGEKINTAKACLSVDLTIAGCVVDGNNADVTVRRGAGDADLGEITLIFGNPDGSTTPKNQSGFPLELETKLYPDVVVGFTAEDVAVSGGITDSQGEISPCQPTQPVVCIPA